MELRLYDKFLAINTKAITVAAHQMDVIKFNIEDINIMDMIIKRALRERRFIGKQESDERRYV